MDPSHVILVFVAGAGLGLVLLGGSVRARRLRRQDPLKEVRREQEAVSKSPQGLIAELELRLYEYGRGIEARMENHLVVLDQLILDADREIARLEGLLAESRQDLPADRPLSRGEQQRCFALWEARMSATEIAQCLNTSVAEVEAALDEWRRPEGKAA